MDTLKRSPKILYKAFFINIFALVFSSLANRIAGIVDSVLAGHMLGSQALSAIKLVLSVPDQFVTALIVLLGVGLCATLISYKAKGYEQSANVIFTAIIVVSLIISVLLCVLFLLFARNIILFFSAESEFVALSLDYFYPFALFLLLFIYKIIFRFIRISSYK